MSNYPSELVYISASWLNSSLLRWQNNRRKLLSMVLLIFLSHTISIFHFKYFSLSFPYWIWHFDSGSFAYWMWRSVVLRINIFFMPVKYMMYSNNISHCLSKAFISFYVNITCALQSLFQCSARRHNVLLPIYMMDNITKVHWREKLFILWKSNKSSRKACAVGLMDSLLKAKWARVK